MKRQGKLITVLGMHRSGTSVITRGLRCLGVSLGDHLIPAAPDNPKGFFEDADLLRINVRLLRATKSGWDRPPRLGSKLARLSSGQLGDEARRALTLKLRDDEMLAIKDPRLCVLLDFWRPVIAAVVDDASSVIVFRHPLSVAASLAVRDHIAETQAVDMWQRYTLEACNGIDPRWPTVVVEYDAMLARPISELSRLGESLCLELDMEAARDFQDSFLEESLCHHKPPTDKPVALSDSALAIYGLLRAAARSSGTLDRQTKALLAAHAPVAECGG